MKKFIIAMIAVVLGLSSCSKESKLLGSWELETIEASGETVSMKELEELVGEKLSVVLTFNEGGKVDIKTPEGSDSLSYSVKGKKLTIDDFGEFEFEVKNSKLILKGNVDDFGDFGGEYCTLTFKKL